MMEERILRLTEYEKALLSGDHGEAVQMAMKVLYDLGEYYGAEEFVEITACHDDSTVFFGEALIGSKMPNLTYMLAFESEAEQKANWGKFGSDPDWKRLSGMAEYADKAILCGITNLLLKPAEYSQI
jgi:hypothetical protein